MTTHRGVSWFPRAWRERYGEEFEALLDDLKAERRLGLLASSDVLKTALRTQLDARRGRRPIAALLATFAILGTALGLGISLGGAAAGSTFVVPPIWSTTAPALANPSTNLACALASPLASGERLTSSDLPADVAGPGDRSVVASSGTTEGLKWRLLERDDAVTRSEPLVVRLLAGGLAVNGHWYSLCGTLRQGVIPPITSGSTYGLVATGVRGNGGSPAFVYGLAPADAQDLRLQRGDGAATIPTIIGAIGNLRLFITPWSANPCGTAQQITVSYVTAQEAWNEVTVFGPACQPGEPALASNGGGGGGAGRTSGTISRVGATSFVLSTKYWAPLRVDKTAATQVFVNKDDVPSGQRPFKAVPWSHLSVGARVFVAGVIGQSSAKATDVYILPR